MAKSTSLFISSITLPPWHPNPTKATMHISLIAALLTCCLATFTLATPVAHANRDYLHIVPPQPASLKSPPRPSESTKFEVSTPADISATMLPPAQQGDEVAVLYRTVTNLPDTPDDSPSESHGLLLHTYTLTADLWVSSQQRLDQARVQPDAGWSVFRSNEPGSGTVSYSTVGIIPRAKLGAYDAVLREPSLLPLNTEQNLLRRNRAVLAEKWAVAVIAALDGVVQRISSS
ncbi:MAG: hypothetical protein M1829_000810 [Trizodia sp. TS-e1964]|nr:MAG: hypothetical protein M1829_000810 [Trizodia sp. TS-e1964]